MRSIFSGGDEDPGAREAVELYRDALDQIASRATAGKRGDRIFPFNLITIELRADNAERKAVLETLFDPGTTGRRYPGDPERRTRHAAGRSYRGC